MWTHRSSGSLKSREKLERLDIPFRGACCCLRRQGGGCQAIFSTWIQVSASRLARVHLQSQHRSRVSPAGACGVSLGVSCCLAPQSLSAVLLAPSPSPLRLPAALTNPRLSLSLQKPFCQRPAETHGDKRQVGSPPQLSPGIRESQRLPPAVPDTGCILAAACMSVCPDLPSPALWFLVLLTCCLEAESEGLSPRLSLSPLDPVQSPPRRGGISGLSFACWDVPRQCRSSASRCMLQLRACPQAGKLKARESSLGPDTGLGRGATLGVIVRPPCSHEHVRRLS